MGRYIIIRPEGDWMDRMIKRGKIWRPVTIITQSQLFEIIT